MYSAEFRSAVKTNVEMGSTRDHLCNSIPVIPVSTGGADMKSKESEDKSAVSASETE